MGTYRFNGHQQRRWRRRRRDMLAPPTRSLGAAVWKVRAARGASEIGGRDKGGGGVVAGSVAHPAGVSVRDVPALACQLPCDCVAGFRLAQRQLHTEHATKSFRRCFIWVHALELGHYALSVDENTLAGVQSLHALPRACVAWRGEGDLVTREITLRPSATFSVAVLRASAVCVLIFSSRLISSGHCKLGLLMVRNECSLNVADEEGRGPVKTGCASVPATTVVIWDAVCWETAKRETGTEDLAKRMCNCIQGRKEHRRGEECGPR